jgi:hypothetical protein
LFEPIFDPLKSRWTIPLSHVGTTTAQKHVDGKEQRKQDELVKKVIKYTKQMLKEPLK